MSPTVKPASDPKPDMHATDVDAMLRGFFQAEMPEIWTCPAVNLPEAKRPPEPVSGRPLSRLAGSRWALAATIALLFFGFALLSQRRTDNLTPNIDRGSFPAVGKKPDRGEVRPLPAGKSLQEPRPMGNGFHDH